MTQGFPWPNGARCAAAVTFDIDLDSPLHYHLPADAHRRVGCQSLLRYDIVGVRRLLELYERIGVRQTFFVPGWCVKEYPDVARSIHSAGHELAAHGYMHEIAHELTPQRERELLARTLDVYERTIGERPRGWRGPLYTFTDVTARLLADEGFLWDSTLMSDDRPYLLKTEAGELIELPIDMAMDDGYQTMNVPELEYVSPQRAPKRAMEVFRAEFEAAYAGGGLWIAVFHPFVSARASRIAEIEGLFGDMLKRGDVWIAPLGEIAAHVRRKVDDGLDIRVDALPYYTRALDAI